MAICRGSRATSAATAPSAITTIAAKVIRHPKCSPMIRPIGTPSTLASVRPVNISAIACERRWGGTSPAATTDPMPKKVPWARAVMTRAAISRP